MLINGTACLDPVADAGLDTEGLDPVAEIGLDTLIDGSVQAVSGRRTMDNGPTS